MTEALIESAEGFAPEEFRGMGVELVRSDDALVGFILDDESQLAEEGWNLSIFVCSRKCSKAADRFLALPAPIELRGLKDDFPSGVAFKSKPARPSWRELFRKD